MLDTGDIFCQTVGSTGFARYLFHYWRVRVFPIQSNNLCATKPNHVSRMSASDADMCFQLLFSLINEQILQSWVGLGGNGSVILSRIHDLPLILVEGGQ